MSKSLWPEAVNTAAYVLNRVVLNKYLEKTAYEAWFKKKPDVGHLNIFGSSAYLNVPKEKERNLILKAEKRYWSVTKVSLQTIVSRTKKAAKFI